MSRSNTKSLFVSRVSMNLLTMLKIPVEIKLGFKKEMRNKQLQDGDKSCHKV